MIGEKITATQAGYLADKNQIWLLLTLIEDLASQGRRKLTHHEPIGNDTSAELRQLGYELNSFSDDTATWYEITW